MTDYFSRLVQQTGLTFKPGGEAQTVSAEPSSLEANETDETAPHEVEETRLIEPQPDQTAEQIPERASEKAVPSAPVAGVENVQHSTEPSAPVIEVENVRHSTEPSASVIEVENIQHSPEDRLESRIPEEPRSPSEREVPKRREPKPESEAWVVLDREPHPKREVVPLQNESVGEELLEKEITVEPGAAGDEDTQHPGEPPVSASQQFEKDLISKPETKSDERISRERVWHTTLQEVREWVAESPDLSLAESQKREASQPVNLEKEIPSVIVQSDRPVISEQRPAEVSPGEEPDIHDFHLSIGTIRLTIEEPQSEDQRHKPAQTGPEKKPVRRNDSSRLSRHYIRI